MNLFNKSGKALVILAIIVFIPASGYAIVDLNAYGGYAFSGELEKGTEKSDLDGWQNGF